MIFPVNMIKILLSGSYVEIKKGHFLIFNYKKAEIGSTIKVIMGELNKPKPGISYQKNIYHPIADILRDCRKSRFDKPDYLSLFAVSKT